MTVKIIEGLQPWEVMKRASEGEPVAVQARTAPHPDGTESRIVWVERKDLTWNWAKNIYAIIDTSTPALDWDKFDLEFFAQYGGLPVRIGGMSSRMQRLSCLQDGTELRESPFYYWPGGKQPVPDNVEVEIIIRGNTNDVDVAKLWWWWRTGGISDIIAFRLTGGVK